VARLLRYLSFIPLYEQVNSQDLTSASRVSERTHTHGAIALSLLILAFVILFFLPVRELIRDWQIDSNYQHGFLIPIISVYLIWQKRNKLWQISFQPAFAKGFITLLFSMLLFIVGTAGAEWFLSRIAMLICLIGLVIYFGGMALFRQLWFPLLFLGFMIPMPYVIYYRLTFPLQQLASFSAFQAMQVFGIPGLREGNILYFAGYSLEVVEACSGLRSMMVLMALAALVAHLAPLSNPLRWLLFAAAVPIAIVANVFRLIIIAALGIFWSAEVAKGFMHEGSGILVFICGLFLLLVLAGILQWFNFRKRTGLSSV
jgi:exosortase